MQARFSAAVVGATGYTGAELLRLLAHHPDVAVTRVTSERLAGKKLSESCPWLDTDLVLESFDPDAIREDVVFLCQEAGFAMRHAASLMQKAKVIDLSADFRLREPYVYEAWYKQPHTAPELLASAVYGLPELFDVGPDDRLIANPGCYVTASLLALRPLTEVGLVTGLPVIDAKSGVSGAGRSKADTDYLFTELDGGFRAYGVTGHRHTPEIEQGLGGVRVRFIPHLLPIPRGLHATIHFPVAEETTAEHLRASWREVYGGRPFVRVLESGWPSTKAVLGSNRCLLAADVDARTQTATVVAVLDNLVKGASGQAVQNMNLVFGLAEETGLDTNGVWP